MARVNVEQKALTDSRFPTLGALLLEPAIKTRDVQFLRFFGLGAMLMVWNECQERETDVLDPSLIVFAIGIPNADRAVVEASLGRRTRSGNVRICGAKERCLWLKDSRERGRKAGHLGAAHGAKGGRPRGAPQTEPPFGGVAGNPPPAPAPAPAPESLLPPVGESPPSGPSRDLGFGVVGETECVAARRAEPRPRRAAARLAPALVALDFPCIGPDPAQITHEQLRRWIDAYPAVDVPGEIKRAGAWCEANTRKTRAGVPRFLVRWLGRAQDNGPGPGGKAGSLRSRLEESGAEFLRRGEVKP